MNEILRFKRHVLYLFGVVFLFVTVSFGFEQITRFPRGLMTDDSFFYAKIAYNLGVHGISSFDGVNITDGYHLLWAWVLALPTYVLSYFTLNVSYHLGAMLLVYFGICWYIAVRFSKNIVQFLYFLFWGIILKIFMETTLLALLLLLFIHDELLSDEPSPTCLGYCLAFLVPLARIDGSIFIVILSLCYLIKFQQPQKFFYTNIFLFAGILSQLAFMKLFFGSFTSVSSELKASHMLQFYENMMQNMAGLYLGKLLSFVIFLVLFFVTLLNIYDSNDRPKAKLYIISASASIFIGIQLMTNSDLRYWYYIPSFYIFLYVSMLLSSSNKLYIRWITHLAIIGIIAAFLAKWGVDSVVRKDQIEYSRKFVKEMKYYVPQEESVFQIDGAGYIGFFSERRVINGDGLVNTHRYAKRLQKNNLSDYLQNNNIKYIVHNNYAGDETLIQFHGLNIKTSDVVTLIQPPQNFPPLTAFGLYRLKNVASVK